MFLMACLPLLMLAACSSDDEPNPESPEKVYSLNKSQMADMVENRVWIIDYDSEKCYDGSEEIDGEYVSYSSARRNAFMISGNKIWYYTHRYPDNWDKCGISSIFREEDGFIYTPYTEYLTPDIRIESVSGDKLTISCYFGHITQYWPDGSHFVNQYAHAVYECRMATPQEKEFYENVPLMDGFTEE